MNSFVDDGLVGLALLAGFGYAGYALGPKWLRARLLTGLASLLGRLYLPGLRRVAARLTAKADRLRVACGGCDTCGSNAAPVARSGASSAPAGPSARAAEVRVPVSRIGRR